jgi:hypothetical protein
MNSRGRSRSRRGHRPKHSLDCAQLSKRRSRTKAGAEKSNLTVDYISGEKIEKYVEQIYSISPEIKERLNFLVKRPRTS